MRSDRRQSKGGAQTTRQARDASVVRWRCCLRRQALLLVAVLPLLSRAVWAQEVGTIAALEGSGKIGRGGAWSVAAIGAPIHQGDELRTGRPGRLRVVFQDDTVLTVSDDSRVVVDEQVFQPKEGKTRSALELLQGKVSALVSEYYHESGASYEIRTATAVAGVRGTDFVMKYDQRDDLTEVVGLSGRVEVRSASDRTGRGVFITAREVTTIARGQLPKPPRRLSDVLFRQYIEGIEFIGAGAAESLTTGHSLLAGASVPKPDRAGTATALRTRRERLRTLREPRDASGIIHQPTAVFGSGGRLRLNF